MDPFNNPEGDVSSDDDSMDPFISPVDDVRSDDDAMDPFISPVDDVDSIVDYTQDFRLDPPLIKEQEVELLLRARNNLSPGPRRRDRRTKRRKNLKKGAHRDHN